MTIRWGMREKGGESCPHQNVQRKTEQLRYVGILISPRSPEHMRKEWIFIFYFFIIQIWLSSFARILIVDGDRELFGRGRKNILRSSRLSSRNIRSLQINIKRCSRRITNSGTILSTYNPGYWNLRANILSHLQISICNIQIQRKGHLERDMRRRHQWRQVR